MGSKLTRIPSNSLGDGHRRGAPGRRDLDRERRDREAVHRVLDDPADLPGRFKAWISQWVEVNPPRLSYQNSVGVYNVPRFRVYSTTPVTVTTGGGGTSMTFDATRYDPWNMHATSSGCVLIPKDGIYHFGAGVHWDASAAGHRFVKIRLNGTTDIGHQTTMCVTTAGAGTEMTVACDYQCKIGDFVAVTAFQNSGANLRVLNTGNISPEFWGHFVGDYSASA